MSGQIRMTPETMRARAAEYSTQASNVQDVINKMDNLLKQLKAEWEGDAAQGFETRFNELRPGFVKAQELIEEISAALKSSVTKLDVVFSFVTQ